MMMMTPEEILRIRDGVGEEVPPGQGDDGVLPGNQCQYIVYNGRCVLSTKCLSNNIAVLVKVIRTFII